MRRFSDISLKSRLLAGGLLCAVLTGLTGLTSILSLNTIHGRLEETTSSIETDLAFRNARLSHLAVLQGLIDRMEAAGDEAELDRIRDEWERLATNPEDQGSTCKNRAALLEALNACIACKGAQLRHAHHFDGLILSHRRIIDEITGLTRYLEDTTDFDVLAPVSLVLDAVDRTLDRMGFEPRERSTERLGSIRDLLTGLHRSVQDSMATLRAVHALRTGCERHLVLVKDLRFAKTAAEADRYGTESKKLTSILTKALETLVREDASMRLAHMVEELDAASMRLVVCRKDALRSRVDHDDALSRIRDLDTRKDLEVTRIDDELKDSAERTLKGSSSQVVQLRLLNIGLVTGAFLLAILVSIAVARPVIRRIGRLAEGMRIVGEGRLDVRTDTGTRDEIGRLSRAFDAMTGMLAHRELTLGASEKRFRRLFDQSGDGIIIHDLRGRITEVNERISEMVFHTKDRLLELSLFDLMPQDERNGLVPFLGRITRERRVRWEASLSRSDGSVIDVDIRASVFDELNGLVQTLVQDITERKRAETELKRRMEEIQQANDRLEMLVSKTTERELRMVKLKEEVNELLEASGRSPRYRAPHRVARLLGIAAGEQRDPS